MNKYIYIQISDYRKLQRYLNHQSAKGYHASKIGKFKISFTYDPSVQYYYQVTLPEKSQALYFNQERENKRSDFMATFGLTRVKSISEFEVFYGSEKIELSTDPNIDDKERTQVMRNFFVSTLILVLVYSFNIISLTTLKLYDVLVSGPTQSLLLVHLLLSGFFINSLINIYKVARKKSDVFLGYRWKSGHIDPILTLLYIILTLIFGLVFPGGIMIPFIIIMTLGYIEMINKSSSIDHTLKRNYTKVIMATMCLTFIFGILPMFRYEYSMNSQKSESVFAKEQLIFDNNNNGLASLDFKTTLFKPYLRKHFLLNFGINEIPQPNVITPMKNKYNELVYVYWDYNTILLSVDQDLIDKALPKYN